MYNWALQSSCYDCCRFVTLNAEAADCLGIHGRNAPRTTNWRMPGGLPPLVQLLGLGPEAAQRLLEAAQMARIL